MNKMISDKKKSILVLTIIISTIVAYLIINAHSINYTMVIDEQKSNTDEYSNVELSASIVNLPFDYLFLYGSVSIDNQKMSLGSFTYGKYQFAKRHAKHDMITFHYYNPRFYSEDYQETKYNISRGTISLWKDPNDLTFSYGDIRIMRSKLHTTMSQAIVLCGELISKNDK